MLSAIVLAAGESRRMGKPKLLMPWGGSTLLGQTVDHLLASAVDEVIVVVGHEAGKVRAAIAGKPVKIAENPDYGQGMSTSIIAGLKLVDKRAEAIMIAMGDQPLIDAHILTCVIAEFRKCGKGIAVPTYQGRRGHPVIFSLKYRGALLNLRGDTGGRQIIKEHAADALEVPVDSASVCLDIDSAGDYLEAIKREGG